MPGWLQSVQLAGFVRNPRPTSSECAARSGLGHLRTYRPNRFSIKITIISTVWGCAFEDFLTRETEDGRNIVDDYLKTPWME
jgi:hypothetical protein